MSYPTSEQQEYTNSGAAWLVLVSQASITQTLRRVGETSVLAIRPDNLPIPDEPLTWVEDLQVTALRPEVSGPLLEAIAPSIRWSGQYSADSVPPRQWERAGTSRDLIIDAIENGRQLPPANWIYLGVFAKLAVTSVVLTSSTQLQLEITIDFSHRWLEDDLEFSAREEALHALLRLNLGFEIDLGDPAFSPKRRDFRTHIGNAQIGATATIELSATNEVVASIAQVDVDTTFSHSDTTADVTSALDAVRREIPDWIVGAKITPAFYRFSEENVQLATTDDQIQPYCLAIVAGNSSGNIPPLATHDIAWWVAPQVSAQNIHRKWTNLPDSAREFIVRGTLDVSGDRLFFDTKFVVSNQSTISPEFADPNLVSGDGSDDAFQLDMTWTATVLSVRRGGQGLSRADWPPELETQAAGDLSLTIYLNRVLSTAQLPEMRRFLRELNRSVTWQLREPFNPLVPGPTVSQILVNAMYGVLGTART